MISTPTQARVARGLSLARIATCALVLCACGSASHDAGDAAREDAGGDAARAGPHIPSLPVTDDGELDLSGGAWRMVEVPGAGGWPRIVRTPEGFLALSSRSFGGKALTDAESILYRSRDGVRWDAVRLESDALLMLSGLAYGNGRYVMVGRNGASVVWTSTDGIEWTERPQELDYASAWGGVRFVGGRFFAHGFTVLGVSEDGDTWQNVTIEVVQVGGLAHGAGRYVMTGSGPVLTSEDGLSWQSHPVDCALPETCITDPSGGIHPLLLYETLFAEGQFFTGRLASPDGVSWSVASELPPHAYHDGYFLSLNGYELHAWRAGEAPQAVPLTRPYPASVTAAGRDIRQVGALDYEAPLPDRVEVPFEDGLDCETATCLLVAGRLLLVPPPGTEPLPDRVPRRDDGEPLLSDACPTSSAIFCDDYAARSGCRCESAAPRGPDFCADVGQYRCEGSFTPRPDEWQVDEVAEAGCSCDGVDQNQPATFAMRCEPGGSTCQAPLTCLQIVSAFTDGPAPAEFMCTASCTDGSDCPSWEATGFCAGPVTLPCVNGVCQPRSCE